MLEAKISDLQSQLNSITEQQTENALNGSRTDENQTKEIDYSDSSTDDF